MNHSFYFFAIKRLVTMQWINTSRKTGNCAGNANGRRSTVNMNQKGKVTHGESNKLTKRKSWVAKIKSVFQTKQRDKSSSIKKEKMLRQTPEVLPFLQIHDDSILLKDGVMDILQIQTKNIHALNDTDLNVLLMNRTRFLRSYFRSYKE